MKKIEIGHGSGGKLTRDLIEKTFLKYLKSKELRPLEDAATIELSSKVAFTTDSYVIYPLFFPGGNIGKLSVCGTVNDLTVSGAVPKYMSIGLILEEGFLISDLEKIMEGIRDESARSGIRIVTGDTKVVEKNRCDGVYINTTGVGEIIKQMSPASIISGDSVIVTGTIGDHGTAIAIVRNEFEIEASLESDCASLNSLLSPLFKIDGVRWMRDPTRGGVATVLNELSEATGLGVEIYEKNLPVKENVKFISDMLGYDPLYMANEGKAIIIASAESADNVISILRENSLGRNSAVIGKVSSKFKNVRLKTAIGGERVLGMLEEELLPRIC